MAVLRNNCARRREVVSKKLNSPPPMNEFQWLLVLGFPADIAAALVAPETFVATANAA